MTPKLNLKALFPDFETKKFPVELCTDQDPREEGVQTSNARFVCVIVDERFGDDDRCEVQILRPYTADDNVDGKKPPYKKLYGWLDIEGMNYIDHCTRAIHLDERKVVAWKPFVG